MKIYRFICLLLVIVLLAGCGQLSKPAESQPFDTEIADPEGTVAVFRLYNSQRHKHFYTVSAELRDDLISEGWDDEGVAWYAPEYSDNPVYRLYNRKTNDNLFTMFEDERADLIALGWEDQGIAWYSLPENASENGVMIQRLYDWSTGDHLFTASAEEFLNLWDSWPWEAECMAFYGYAAEGVHEQNHEHNFVLAINDSDVNYHPGCDLYVCECDRMNVRPAGAWTITKVPTEKESGIKERSCDKCRITEREEIPAGTLATLSEETIFFSNANERNQLYSIRADGTDLQPVLDQPCYNVLSSNGKVVYSEDRYGGDLYLYDTVTKENTLLEEFYYGIPVIDGDYLYYDCYPDHADGDCWCGENESELVQYNLSTGERTVILHTPDWISNLTAGYGILYFIGESDAEYIYAYDPETKQLIQCVAGDYYKLFAVDGGVICCDFDDNLHYISFNGSEDINVPEEMSADALIDLFYSDNVRTGENGFVFEELGDVYSIYYQPFDAERIYIAGTKSWDDSIEINKVGEDLFLIGYSQYDVGGTSYMLLDTDFFNETQILISLDTKGEISRMFQDGDFPLIDCSTARRPLTKALYRMFVTGSGNEGQEPICSTTHGAWLNIADRKADLAFLAAPTEEEQAYLKEKGVEIDMKLYAGDALAFIVNSENPVKNLTHQQIIDIYTGKITNWSEVGGPDHKINVCYRDDQSGSQRLFESIVFKGLELPDYEALGFEYDFGMSDIVDSVCWDPYAIGYSIMTYLNDSYYDMEELQILSVNGVTPTPETVMDSSYAYSTKGYIVIRSDEPEDSPARRLYNWFGCAVSDELLIEQGISPIREE